MSFGPTVGGTPTHLTPDSITVGGVSGTPLPTPSDSTIFGIEGASPSIQATVLFDGLMVGERYRFESINLSFTVPADYDPSLPTSRS